MNGFLDFVIPASLESTNPVGNPDQICITFRTLPDIFIET